MSKLPHIQVLRAFAALSVAMLHAQHEASAVAAKLDWQFQPVHFVPWAAGVDVFFVISGFIMVYVSQRLFAAPGAVTVFLVRRMGRIVPLYWGLTTLYLAVALATPGLLNSEILDPGFIVASYLFIPFERPDGVVQPLYSLGWTLNYEVFFYLLFAGSLALPQRRAVPVLICVLTSAAALGKIFTFPQPLGFWTNPIVLEFAFGMALGLLKAEGVVLPRSIRAAVVIVGAALLIVWADRDMPRVAAYGIPAALFVAAAALGAERAGRNSWVARSGAALGDASYALYLIHPFVIRGGRELMLGTGLGEVVGPWGYLLLAMLGVILAALLVFRWFERPMVDLVRQRLEQARLKPA